MTCKDCIHYDLCGTLSLPLYPDSIDRVEELCDYFKNKADFVEVVRCKDCLHKLNIEGRCMCNINAENAFGKWLGLRATLGENFCGFGERRDT